MFKNLMNRMRHKGESESRQTRAQLLLEYLEQNGALTLDKKGLSILGLSRKQAFQIVYDLVLDERIQMRAEADGRVIVMSNAAFAEHLERRAREAAEKDASQVIEEDQLLDLALVAFGEENGMEPEYYAYSRNSLPVRSREPWMAGGKIS
ncbi:MAG: hypothetical protein LBT97_00670 [Planctomycetota bacterium]|nr:hypothetical protein [Planctomycetota bacterium]